MGVFHYLNVLDGDCSIIQHPSGHVTVIDVNNASQEEDTQKALERVLRAVLEKSYGVSGNFNQKYYPVNPIKYLMSFDISSVFRFILTHPDMDHMGGIKDFFECFAPVNFWDTDNEKDIEFDAGCPYNEQDWDFYTDLRDTSKTQPKRLALYAGARGKYFNQDEQGNGGGDGLYLLAPTPELLKAAIEEDDYNDASYVILYRTAGGRILFSGDSHNRTWEHVLATYSSDVKDVDVLIAPHHGRKSDRCYEFLDTVNPKLTLFGNANSEHLAYDAWSKRGLPVITNNQANCVVIDGNGSPMRLYVTNETFAKHLNPDTFYEEQFKAFYCLEIE